MSFDNSPGSPDGPPTQPEPMSGVEKAGAYAGLAFLLMIVLTLGAGLAWVAAWLVVNFPAFG